MEISTEYKSFNRDKSVEELKYDCMNWNGNLQLLKIELAFLKGLLDYNIYEPHTINLFETLQLLKKNIDDANKKIIEFETQTTHYMAQLDENFKCKFGNCSRFYIELHEKKDYDLYEFFNESNNLKIELFQFIQSTIRQ
tara:strand:- start:163 stop:579 length:417 start_codon:yes stop_codon:yes gene_type:complete